MTEITKEAVEQRIEAGESLRAIAQSFGISHQALSDRRYRWGGKRLRAKGVARLRRTDGTFIDCHGYVQVKTSSRPGAMAYTSQHVIVAKEMLGRALLPGEIVHHIDGNKQNNQPENLHVCSRSHHRIIHRSLESLATQLVRAGLLKFVKGAYEWKENSPLEAFLRESGVLTSD